MAPRPPITRLRNVCHRSGANTSFADGRFWTSDVPLAQFDPSCCWTKIATPIPTCNSPSTFTHNSCVMSTICHAAGGGRSFRHRGCHCFVYVVGRIVFFFRRNFFPCFVVVNWSNRPRPSSSSSSSSGIGGGPLLLSPWRAAEVPGPAGPPARVQPHPCVLRKPAEGRR